MKESTLMFQIDKLVIYSLLLKIHWKKLLSFEGIKKGMEKKKVWKSIEDDNYSVVINYIKEQCCRITEYFNSIPRKVMKSCFMVLIGELLHWWYWCMRSVIITAWKFHYLKKKGGGGQLPEVILYKSQK